MKRGLRFSVRGSLSPAFAPPETGLSGFPSWIPKSSCLYFLLGPRLLMVTSSWSVATDTTWGCPSLSLYWTTKESNLSSGTTQPKGPQSRVRGHRGHVCHR